MTKAEYLELASQRYDEFQELNKIDNFYDYEVKYETVGTTMDYRRSTKYVEPESDKEKSTLG